MLPRVPNASCDGDDAGATPVLCHQCCGLWTSSMSCHQSRRRFQLDLETKAGSPPWQMLQVHTLKHDSFCSVFSIFIFQEQLRLEFRKWPKIFKALTQAPDSSHPHAGVLLSLKVRTWKLVLPSFTPEVPPSCLGIWPELELNRKAGRREATWERKVAHPLLPQQNLFPSSAP